MAKLYGLLSGQAVQTLISGAALRSAPPACGGSADQVLWRDMATTNGNLIGDVVSLGSFRPTAIIDAFNSQMWFGSAAATTVSFGDATFPAGLRAAFAMPGGATPILTPPPAARVIAPLWQLLGYAASPGLNIELLATLGAVNPANGQQLGWQIFGRNV